MVEQAAVNGRRFADVQRSFAAHIRDPQGQPRPAGVDERRMAVYRELVFNNIASLLAANFPVIRQILDDEHWEQLVRGFFIHHRCTTPLFHELGQEFLSYLQEVRAGDPQDPPFLLELAHYEWVELALDISEEEPDPALANPNGDLLAETPVVSPLGLEPKLPLPGAPYRPRAPARGASPRADSPGCLPHPCTGAWISWRSTP